MRGNRLLVGLTCLLAPALAALTAGGQAARDEDPLPLRRIALSPDELPAAMAKLKARTLERWRRAEFEARLRRAARAAAPRPVARIVRAQYQAELVGQDLGQGRGEWVVENHGPGAAPLPLTPLTLALSKCSWEDGSDAVVGDLDGRGLAAWVERAGTASLFLDWSCRGTPTPHGLTFDLRLPACPQTSLELKLPADYWPAVAPKAGLLTGPHDAGAAGKKLWRLQLAGKTQVELTLRRTPAGAPPVLFYQGQGRQIVTPDRVAADYDFQIEVPHDAVRTLAFDGDGTLEPFEVSARSADLRWRWEPPSAREKSGTLHVEFREPQQGTIAGLRVRCHAPRTAAPAEWISPGLRLRHAVCRGESLKLQVHPDVQLGLWDGRDFQLTGCLTEADGALALQMVNVRATTGAVPARPRCRLLTGAAEFTTEQRTRWHVAPEGPSLQCAIALHVVRGPLYQLAVKLPTAGGPYRVESVEAEPRGLLRDWAPAGPLVLIDLQRGLTPRMDARLILRLRGGPLHPAGPVNLALSDIEPLGASLRTGTLEVTLDPQFHAQLVQSSVPVAAALPDGSPPGPDGPAFAFPYRNQVPAGTLRIFPLRPQLEVRSRQEADLGPAGGRWQARVEIEPSLGRPATLDVYLSAGLAGPWHVQADGPAGLVHHWERLAIDEVLPQLLLLAPGNAAAQAALRLGLPHGQLWRIHFAQPLARKTTLVISGRFGTPARSLPGGRWPFVLPGPSQWQMLGAAAVVVATPTSAGTTWAVPVLSVPGARQQEGTLVLRPAGQTLTGVTGQDVGAMAPTGGGDLTIRLGAPASAFPAVEARTQPGQARPSGSAVCAVSTLTTCMADDGTLEHLLYLRLRDWQEARLPIVVPGGARVIAARVDGAWLEHVEVAPAADGTRITLPVVAGAAVQQIELLYAPPAGAGASPLIRAVAAASPRLPLEPLVQRRYWRLPAGWRPWDGAPLRRRGEPEGLRQQDALAALPARAWHAGETWLPSWDATATAWLDAQRSDLLAAEAKLRPRLDAATTLGTAIGRLAAELQSARDPIPLVIDLEGLRAAGRWPRTPLGERPAPDRPFWEALGLVYVPCPAGALFTTPRRHQHWLARTGDAIRLGTMLEPAVSEAAFGGMDRAGCFAPVHHWLRMAAPAPSASPSADLGRAFARFTEPIEAGWTEWEPRPGVPPSHAIVVGYGPAGRWLGYALAAAWWVVAAWVGWRLAATAFFRVHLVCASLLTLAVLWLPTLPRDLFAIPLLCAEALAFAIVFTARPHPGPGTRPSRSTMVRPTAAALVLVLAGAALPVLGQAPPAGPEPYPVYLVEEYALVPPELLKKLTELEARPAGPTGAVVVAAQYQGRVKDGGAAIEARFDLYHFAEQGTLVLPLTGVRLRPGVFVDGAPVFPVAHKGGYAVPLTGKGAHRLTLSFDVTPAAVNDALELRFGIPRAGQCRLELTWEGPARGLHLSGGLGEMAVQLDKRGGAALRAQLGHEGTVVLRWLAAAAVPPSRAVEVRELYAWDLRPIAPALTAAVQFTIARGSLAQVRFALPEGLEVRGVELAGRPGAGGVPTGAAVRGWEVTGKDAARQLVVDFAQPVAGNVPLVIDLVPRLALVSGPWLLRLPAPLLGTTTEGLLAYRLDGMDAAPSPQNLSIATVPVEAFSKAWARAVSREPPAVSRTASFRRTAPAAALSLAAQPARPAAQADVTWTVGPRRAELSARIAVNSPADDLVLVELELPPRFQLAHLAGSQQVHHWSRQDQLVQVWLQQPRKRISLEVHGWVEHPTGPPRFELAPLRVRHVRSLTSVVSVVPEPGLALRAERLLHLAGDAEAGAARFTTNEPNYAGSFQLTPRPVTATGTAFTLVERRGAVVEMTTALHLHASRGEVRVRVSGWKGDGLRLDATAPVQHKGQHREGGRHVWTLQFPAGLPQTVTLTLHGQAPADQPGGTWTLPDVQIDPVPLRERWVGLFGVEPAAGDELALLPAAGRDPANYPAPPRALPAGTRLGRLKDAAAAPAVRVPPSAAAAPVHPLLVRQDTFWSGAGWAHRLDVLAFTQGAGELRVRLPAGADCRAVVVDERLAPPGAESAAGLVIPLAGAAGPHTVQLWWVYGDGATTLPRLDRAAVEGMADDAVTQRWWLPAAYQLEVRPADIGRRAAEALLHDAEARMELCSRWAEVGGAPAGALLREQRALYADLAQTEALITLLEQAGEPRAAAELKQRFVRLDTENTRRAGQGGYAAARKAARQGTAIVTTPAVLPRVRNGLPLSGPLDRLPAPTPALEAEAAAVRSVTELVLLTAVALLVLSYLRRGVVLLRAAWPELLTALALVGTVLGGVSPTGVMLLAIGLTLRAAWLVLALRRTLAQRQTAGDAEVIPPQTAG